MDALRAALETALTGLGQLVMLTGESGIGKTRTAQELASYADSCGAQVLWSRCYEGQGAPPYWPWVQAIRVFAGDLDRRKLWADLGHGAVKIAEIVPDLGEWPTDQKTAPELDPEQSRFLLFASVTELFKRATFNRPLVLVMDDLHWASRPSLLLLEFLAQELPTFPFLLVGTYRDTDIDRQHPLTETLGQLARLQVLHRITLRGLSSEDVNQFITLSTRRPPSRELVEAIYGRSEGNSFFMSELVRLLTQEGALSSDELGNQASWQNRIPDGARDVIARRLNRLSQQCNDALTIAAAIGREFQLDQLRVLAGNLSEDELLDAVEDALDSKIIEEIPPVGRYQFAHSLVQQALLEDLSTARLARLHARIAEAFEELYGEAADAHAAELAYHFEQAKLLVGTEKLVRYSLLAGERALESEAHEEALVHFQRALEIKEEQRGSLASEREIDAAEATLLLGLARAQAATLERHRIQESVAVLSRAFDYFHAAGDVPRSIAALTGHPVSPMPGQRTGVSELITRALNLIPADSHEAGRLLSLYGRVMGVEEGDYEKAQQAFAQASTIAQRESDTGLELRTLINASFVDGFYLRWPEWWEKSAKAIRLARLADDPFAEVVARYWNTFTMTIKGEMAEAHRNAEAMLPLAERARDKFSLASVWWSNEFVSRSTGRWGAAREYSDRALAMAPMDPRLLSTRILMEYERGDFAQGKVFLERAVDLMSLTEPGPTSAYSTPAIALPLVSRISGVPDRLDVAQIAGQAVIQSPNASPLAELIARVGLGMLAVLTDDADAAAEQYAALQPVRGTLWLSIISGDRILGLLSRTMGDYGQGLVHFKDALSFCEDRGLRPELAWTCYDYAEALTGSNSPANAENAATLLDRAQIIAQELEMHPLTARVSVALDRLQNRAAPIADYPDGLTRREVDVLRLIAAGKTSGEIAETLIVSPRTVDAHVSNILNKTGLANRAEAAAYAFRHRLVS